MTTCPRCGKTINQQILVPFSEVGEGYKYIECSCGYRIRYEIKGYQEEQEKKRLQNIAAGEAIIKDKTVVVPFKISFIWFAILFIVCTTAIVLFFSVSMWNKWGIDVGITMIILNTFLIGLGTLGVFKRPKYFEDDGTINFENYDKFHFNKEYMISRSKKGQRRLVAVYRFLGFTVYLIAIGVSYYFSYIF